MRTASLPWRWRDMSRHSRDFAYMRVRPSPNRRSCLRVSRHRHPHSHFKLVQYRRIIHTPERSENLACISLSFSLCIQATVCKTKTHRSRPLCGPVPRPFFHVGLFLFKISLQSWSTCIVCNTHIAPITDEPHEIPYPRCTARDIHVWLRHK